MVTSRLLFKAAVCLGTCDDTIAFWRLQSLEQTSSGHAQKWLAMSDCGEDICKRQSSASKQVNRRYDVVMGRSNSLRLHAGPV
jgi:hypothetical protein